MARTGRPKSVRAATAHIVRIKLRLYPGEDDDLLAFFQSIPSGLRAVSVKLALRSGRLRGDDEQAEQDETLRDALDALVF
jgi:hypothetical protein